MLKKILMPLVILGMVFFVQCTDDPYGPDLHNAGKGAGNGGGGNGGGGNGGGGNGDGTGGNGGSNGGNGGSGGLYGDLVICLRDAAGIPDYAWVMGEQDALTPTAQPIMVDEVTLEPLIIDGVYQVFLFNDLGEIIPVDGYIAKEVEFGRLNVVRAPQSVLNSALAEAIVSLTQPGITDILTDASGRLTAIIGEEDWIVNFDDIEGNEEDDDKTIDAPRENVAIYQELMSYGLSGALDFLSDWGYTNTDVLTLAYGAISAGADKTGNMIVDEFCYMNDWLLKWDDISDAMTDEKGRKYYDYAGFTYSRNSVYADKYVRITVLESGGNWHHDYVSLLDAVTWTNDAKRIIYGNKDQGITGFANAADDAVQVLEFIHSSDLIVYSPDFDDTWND